MLPSSPPIAAGRMIRIWQEDYGHAYGPWFEAVPSHAYLYGFWRSERFFAPAAKIVREHLQPRNLADLPPADWLREARKLVGIHVRRGDFLDYQTRFRIIDSRYIARAMAEFDDRFGFVVFTDDPKWCRENIDDPRVRIMPEGDAVRDMLLMSACAHQIIANSSFSWWAAWLNANPRKIVVSPWPWFAPGYRNLGPRDVLPESWRLIPI